MEAVSGFFRCRRLRQDAPMRWALEGDHQRWRPPIPLKPKSKRPAVRGGRMFQNAAFLPPRKQHRYRRRSKPDRTCPWSGALRLSHHGCGPGALKRTVCPATIGPWWSGTNSSRASFYCPIPPWTSAHRRRGGVPWTRCSTALCGRSVGRQTSGGNFFPVISPVSRLPSGGLV